ncbi:MAG: thiamine-phosphate kinase [Pseudomonadales bacterium]|nr:thiamine-phosphate kinase [Pseudomonadales bacterium]
MGEFEIIRQYFSGIGDSSAQVLGVGDDCALLSVPSGKQLAFSIDTQVADLHFPADAPADFIARRALRCALSDLAAMGASPHSFTLALTLPEADEAWLALFSEGLKKDANTFQCALVGGDTTRGPLTLSFQVQGFVSEGDALLRSSAKPGDLVFVSGTLGDAAAGLSLLNPENTCDKKDSKYLLERYFFPQPHLDLGKRLCRLAHACIDVSDGLLADLGHICQSSGVAARLNMDNVPRSPELMRYAGEQALQLATAGGDDYELCFTLPKEKQHDIQQLAKTLGIVLTEIGEITEGEGVHCFNSEGAVFQPDYEGFHHF